MKVRYLPHADRQALHKLRHMTDTDEMAVLFEEVLHREFSIQALWEYRKWFNMLTPEDIKKHPVVAIGCAQVLILDGKIDKAREVISMLPLGSYYQSLIKMYVPGLSKEDMFSLIRDIKGKGPTPVPNMTLTAARPSVLNGVWDFTPYADRMIENKDSAMELIEVLFGEQAGYIYELAYAESMYWRDDCYGALVKIVGIIPFLKERDDMRLLFAALTLEIYIMVLNGQAAVVAPLMENLRKQIKETELNEYLPNIEAMTAWGAMYDGDYETVTKWMRDGAPDENGKFCMLDLFRYMVKMRAYIIQGKHLAVTALAMRLLPLVEGGERYMDTCELHIIWAMSDYADGRKEEAVSHLEVALKLSEKYHYDRLFADEGQRVLELLRYYKKIGKCGVNEEYFEHVLKLTEKTAGMHPRYLKVQLSETPALTNTEMKVLRLLAELYTNGQIAEITGTAEETVKKHCKHIFAKLSVKNRHQAVQRARELGII
ncbi:MAG: hypothetical protein IJB96_12885 [Lachnospira sp.]|nr:hypothetical protein [Lachnospira sp.]